MSRWALSAVFLCSACVANISGAMRPAAGPLSLEASAATARVVIARSASLAGIRTLPTIFDGPRRLVLGQLFNDSYFAVDLEPGVYQLCPAIIPFDESDKPQTAYADPGWVTLMGNPLTRLEVQAGKTYLLQFSHERGRVELIPARFNTIREHQLLSELKYLRPAETVKTSRQFVSSSDPNVLDDFFELCREASGPDLRLRMDADEGKVSATPVAPVAP